MRRSRLVLRSPGWIVLAYLVGPVCGITVWVAAIGAMLARPGEIFAIWVLANFIGVPVCVVVETFVVTPILVAFSQFRWRWLNSWSGAVIGFLLATPTPYLLRSLFPPDEPAPTPDTWQVGPLIVPGWWHEIANQALAIAWFGLIGLVAALVFRLIAVRTARPARATTGGEGPSRNLSPLARPARPRLPDEVSVG